MKKRVSLSLKPLPDEKKLDWSKFKQLADDNFEFDVNSRKFSKLMENTVGKGEIARYEQFLLFTQCFQKVCFPRASKGTIVWEWVKDSHFVLVVFVAAAMLFFPNIRKKAKPSVKFVLFWLI